LEKSCADSIAENSPSPLPSPKTAGEQMLIADFLLQKSRHPMRQDALPVRYPPNHLELWKECEISITPTKTDSETSA